MIRTSTAIGAAALVLSLVVHFVGITLTLPNVSLQETADRTVEQVALGNAFEDLVEARIEPVEPEVAEVPEPPVETAPEPDPATPPTSEALVASPDPRPVPSPDRGPAEAAQPDVSGPVTGETSDTPKPEADMRSGGNEAPVSDARIAPTAASEPESVTPRRDPVDETATSPPVAQALAPPIATVPTVTEPVAPIADTPLPEIIAALPPEKATPEETLLPVDTEQEANGSDLSGESVVSSLRPQIRPQIPSPQPRGTVDGRADQSDELSAPTELIESPLTAYQRDGTNLFAGQRGGAQSGGAGSGNALGPGNSDVTNYAGEVLMHLNRVPPVAVSALGWARVVFRINPDGTLASVDIIDGSGSSDIERAAKAHVSKGVPFPRPPGGKSRLLNFIYQIQ